MAFVPRLDHEQNPAQIMLPNFSDRTLATSALNGLATGMVIGFLIFLFLRLIIIPKYTDSLEVTVNGPFLQIQEGFFFVKGRRLHFSNISDYAFRQGPLLRFCGIYVIEMNGAPWPLTISGVKDGPKVRNILSEVDCLREDLVE